MKNASLILIDAHVHMHDCYHLGDFFSNAVNNFDAIARRTGINEPYKCVLMLTEGMQEDGFERVEALAHKEPPAAQLDGWMVSHTDDEEGLFVKKGERTVLLVSGRQIVTEKGLEVLALGTRQRYKEKRPIRDILVEVASTGAIPVVPWGFGKWIGARAALVESLIMDDSLPRFFLGDNGNRPALWSKHAFFKIASKRGIENLPGSDPLPFPAQQKRPGSFGIKIHAPIHNSKPVTGLKELIMDSTVEKNLFGNGDSLFRFVPNQVRMQLVKRLR